MLIIWKPGSTILICSSNWRALVGIDTFWCCLLIRQTSCLYVLTTTDARSWFQWRCKESTADQEGLCWTCFASKAYWRSWGLLTQGWPRLSGVFKWVLEDDHQKGTLVDCCRDELGFILVGTRPLSSILNSHLPTSGCENIMLSLSYWSRVVSWNLISTLMASQGSRITVSAQISILVKLESLYSINNYRLFGF
jgi:hypothetical protein